MSKKALSYQDVYLVPNKCIVDSRSECDISVDFGGRKFKLPVYPANMKSVVDYNTCKFLAENGLFYSMHRFDIDITEFMNFMKGYGLFTSISLGIGYDSETTLMLLQDQGYEPDYITVDVAHAWSLQCEKFVNTIRKYFKKTFVIVGNIASANAAAEMVHWPINALKVGIAGGLACTTKDKTGFHVPMWTSVRECSQEAAESMPIIADGGTRNHGDISKAIAAGATMVMAGSLFAGFDQSAGSLIEIDKKLYKEYYGSASERNKSQYKNIEGTRMLVEYRGDMNRIIKEITEDLQSSVSYSGSKNLSGLKTVEYITT
jgi:GMP reductase